MGAAASSASSILGLECCKDPPPPLALHCTRSARLASRGGGRDDLHIAIDHNDCKWNDQCDALGLSSGSLLRARSGVHQTIQQARRGPSVCLPFCCVAECDWTHRDPQNCDCALVALLEIFPLSPALRCRWLSHPQKNSNRARKYSGPSQIQACPTMPWHGERHTPQPNGTH